MTKNEHFLQSVKYFTLQVQVEVQVKTKIPNIFTLVGGIGV